VNAGGEVGRANATQRPPREPARIERLGHVVLESARFNRALDWYQQHLGLIVSDFLYFPGQRDRGPTMAFIRCDRGATPADHHTLAMSLGPGRKYIHSAYQVADLDALAAGGEYLKEHRYKHSWGIGRHIEGSQIFDYWRDPDGFLVEHFTDGDMFDDSVEPGWAQMSASGLSQWGPAVTRDFLEVNPSMAKHVLSALADGDNEFTAQRLLGLMKVARS
jgi:catechol 2,3-dioxygenase-like lactoylglutathione lyase family enzyme